MYSIKQASLRSGVSVPLIRAWERRYGVVSPKRTASGYRMYDDEAIATLVRARELTQAGWSASEASRALLAGEVAAAPVPNVQPPQSTRTHRDDQITRFVEAAMEMDIARTSSVLDEMLAVGSYESVIDDVLMPALVALGEAWQQGRLDIAGEHAASAAVHRRLAALYEAAAVSGDPSVVVGLPPGSRHELGALAFAVAVRRLGVGVLYLGAEVPVESWVQVMRKAGRRVAIIAVVTEKDRLATIGVIRALRALRAGGPGPVIATGGRHARWEAAVEAGVLVLPDRIIDAARVTARVSGGGSAAGI